MATFKCRQQRKAAESLAGGHPARHPLHSTHCTAPTAQHLPHGPCGGREEGSVCVGTAGVREETSGLQKG